MPLLILLSVHYRSEFVEDDWLYHDVTEVEEILLKAENEYIRVNIRGTKTLDLVEIIVKEPLQSSSSTVYLVYNEENQDLLGQISSKGTYHFGILDNRKDAIPKYLRFDDYIKEEDIFKIDIE
jgi:hypothetical protein